MKLDGVELVRVDIPMRRAIGTAAGVHGSRSLLFVRVVTDGSEGWGECAALGDGTAVDPPLDRVDQVVRERGVRRLAEADAARGGDVPGASEIAHLFGSSPIDRLMGAVFEMAVTDAELRRAGHSLARSMGIGPGYEALPVGVAVGIPPDHDLGALGRTVAAAVASGAARVRVKIAPGWDVEPVRAIRAAHPALALQADANGSYRLQAPEEDVDAAIRLGELAEFGVLCVEQPLPPGDLVAHAELAGRIAVPIALDESLTSPRRVLDALRNGACQVACLKPGRLGGLGATLRAHAACVDAGVPAFVGGFFEAGLGRAANLALAARLAQDAVGLVSDLTAPETYLAVDPCGYPEVENGWVKVPGGPGVGRWPDDAALARLEAQRHWFPATYT